MLKRQVTYSRLVRERMRISSSGNVGIGNTSPGTKLDVTTVANTAGIRVTAPNTTSQSFGATIAAGTNASDYAFNINNAAGAALLRVRGDGNVGIGTASPVSKFDIYHGSTLRLMFTTTGGTDNFVTSVNGANSAYTNLFLNGAVVKLGTGGSERMRIDASGNVGIGTTTPDEFGIGSTYKYLAVGGDKPGIINLVDSGTAGSYLQFGTAAGVRRASIHAENGSHLSFTLNASNSGTGLTERMRIDRTGDWMVGNSVARVASQYSNQAGCGWRDRTTTLK